MHSISSLLGHCLKHISSSPFLGAQWGCLQRGTPWWQSLQTPPPANVGVWGWAEGQTGFGNQGRIGRAGAAAAGRAGQAALWAYVVCASTSFSGGMARLVSQSHAPLPSATPLSAMLNTAALCEALLSLSAAVLAVWGRSKQTANNFPNPCATASLHPYSTPQLLVRPAAWRAQLGGANQPVCAHGSTACVAVRMAACNTMLCCCLCRPSTYSLSSVHSLSAPLPKAACSAFWPRQMHSPHSSCWHSQSFRSSSNVRLRSRVVAQTMDAAPPWTLDQIAGLAFGVS